MAVQNLYTYFVKYRIEFQWESAEFKTDHCIFPGQPVSWALIAPGISPRTVVEGMREQVTSSPSLRLYKYSVYDGKVCNTTSSLEISSKVEQTYAAIH